MCRYCGGGWCAFFLAAGAMKIATGISGFLKRRRQGRLSRAAKTIICVGSVFSLSVFSGFSADQIAVTATIAPLGYFIEQIGGEHVDVTVMISSAGNPHAYEPTPGQMNALSRSDLYVKVGSGIEFELAWMERLAALNRAMVICDASKGIQLISMGEDQECDGDHHHGEHDPHIWLSFNNAIIMAGNIRDALIAIAPDKEEVFAGNTRRLIVRLDELKREAAQRLQGLEQRTFLVFHPAWGYLARDFDLTQIAAEHLGKEPTPRQMNTLIRQARDLGIRVVFVSPQFSRKSAQVIAREIGGQVAAIDPLAEDYVENMRRVIDALAAGMQ